MLLSLTHHCGDMASCRSALVAGLRGSGLILGSSGPFLPNRCGAAVIANPREASAAGVGSRFRGDRPAAANGELGTDRAAPGLIPRAREGRVRSSRRGHRAGARRSPPGGPFFSVILPVHGRAREGSSGDARDRGPGTSAWRGARRRRRPRPPRTGRPSWPIARPGASVRPPAGRKAKRDRPRCDLLLAATCVDRQPGDRCVHCIRRAHTRQGAAIASGAAPVAARSAARAISES